VSQQAFVSGLSEDGPYIPRNSLPVMQIYDEKQNSSFVDVETTEDDLNPVRFYHVALL